MEKKVKQKRNFKDALENVSKFTSVVRWMFMIISILEMIFACMLWILIFLSDGIDQNVVNLIKISWYFIPSATLLQLVLLIVLGFDALETKTEIKVRIIFVFMSIAPVMMTFKFVFAYWKKLLNIG